MNAFAHLFGKVASLFSSSEPVTEPVIVAQEVTYPYIWEGLDDGYNRSHPELVLDTKDFAYVYPLPAGESRSVTFADGTVAVVHHELISDWDDSPVYHRVTFEMYEEFITATDNF